MSKLSTHARAKLPSSAFVFPKTRSYPIHDESHARAALSDVAKDGNAAEKSAVRAAVHSKYPGIDQANNGPISPADNMVQDRPVTAQPSQGLMGT